MLHHSYCLLVGYHFINLEYWPEDLFKAIEVRKDLAKSASHIFGELTKSNNSFIFVSLCELPACHGVWVLGSGWVVQKVQPCCHSFLGFWWRPLITTTVKFCGGFRHCVQQWVTNTNGRLNHGEFGVLVSRHYLCQPLLLDKEDY